jgi:hypothetical protein
MTGSAAAHSVPTCNNDPAPAISAHQRVGFGSNSGMANLLGRELSAHQHTLNEELQARIMMDF